VLVAVPLALAVVLAGVSTGTAETGGLVLPEDGGPAAQVAGDAGGPSGAADAGAAEPGVVDTQADGGAPGESDEEEEGDDGEGDDGEAEATEPTGPSSQPANSPVHRYSGDVCDQELERRWTHDLESLGTISVGFTHAGRLINGEQIPKGDAWTLVTPEYAWATRETVDYLLTAIGAVAEQFPDTPPLRINHVSRRDGGYLRPHQSHQSGRDVDLALYYARDPPPGHRGRREHLMDPARNWALVKALVTRTDVQVILVDRRIQHVLHDYARSIGEDREWLDGLFKGSASLVKHVRRHRDHFHVRFYAPRSQELGRRVQPLLARRPDHNVTMHRVRRGETLSHIAVRYDTTVTAIRKANHMRGSFLRVGQTVTVPLRKPCTQCPLPPEVVVPPRRLPPPPA
jgi:murein endopeptidase